MQAKIVSGEVCFPLTTSSSFMTLAGEKKSTDTHGQGEGLSWVMRLGQSRNTLTCADDAARTGGERSDLVNVQIRCVGGQDRPVLADSL